MISYYKKQSFFTKEAILNYLKIHNIKIDYPTLINSFISSQGKINIKKTADKENYITRNFIKFKSYCKDK